MEKITIHLKFRELCAIKHALDLRVKKKKQSIMKQGLLNNEKYLKEIVEEEILSNIFNQIIENNKGVYEKNAGYDKHLRRNICSSKEIVKFRR